MERPILIVDARNCMYRAIYAGKHEAARQQGPAPKHHFTQMLRIICSWVRQFNPVSVQLYWDTPRSTVWRKKIYPGYKDRDNNHYIADISQELVATQRVARDVFQHLNCRQFLRQNMEADDLIYAACKSQSRRQIIICSTDSDMIQIPYHMNWVQIYDPEHKQMVSVPDCDPVHQKALVGDKADRIGGYTGIGPVKSKKLLEDPVALHQYLEQNGRGTYIRNLLLIDLSLCPELLANQLYIGKVLATPVQLDRAKLLQLQQQHKIPKFISEYADLVLPFKDLS